MPECEYCSDSFEDEDSYVRHLASEHEGELSRIDQRRVEELGPRRPAGADDGMSSNVKLGFAGFGIIMLIAVALVGFMITGGGSGDEPSNLGAVHEHGTMEITIDGETLDLNDPEFVENDDAFHFHGYEQDRYGADVWHTHAEGVTVQYALDTLGIEVSDDGSELTYDGETYRDEDPGTDITITVNGESVEPADHELRGVGEEAAAQGEGDDVAVEVTTDG